MDIKLCTIWASSVSTVPNGSHLRLHLLLKCPPTTAVLHPGKMLDWTDLSMKNGDGFPGKNLNGWISLHHQEMENDLLENSHPKFGGVFFQLSCGWEGWETQFVAVAPLFPIFTGWKPVFPLHLLQSLCHAFKPCGMSQIWVHCWVMASLKICFKGKRRDGTFEAKLGWNEKYGYIRSDWTAAKMCASRKATGNVVISKRALYKPKKKWDGQLPQLQTSKKSVQKR